MSRMQFHPCLVLRLTRERPNASSSFPQHTSPYHSATSPWGRLERGEISLKEFEVNVCAGYPWMCDKVSQLMCRIG
jgi:hypothetical protein